VFTSILTSDMSMVSCSCLNSFLDLQWKIFFSRFACYLSHLLHTFAQLLNSCFELVLNAQTCILNFLGLLRTSWDMIVTLLYDFDFMGNDGNFLEHDGTFFGHGENFMGHYGSFIQHYCNFMGHDWN
jgi:hypothetical protein